MTEWLKPPYEVQEIDDTFAALPGDVSHLMPEYGSVDPDHEWVEFQQTWFFHGIKEAEFYPKDGINAPAAMRHLTAIQQSFQPKHEHKEEAVAFLAQCWFKKIKLIDNDGVKIIGDKK